MLAENLVIRCERIEQRILTRCVALLEMISEDKEEIREKLESQAGRIEVKAKHQAHKSPMIMPTGVLPLDKLARSTGELSKQTQSGAV